jgi:hypothetical protein
MSRFVLSLLVIVPAVALAPRVALAGLEACGNIDVRAEAECEVVASGGCVAQCEPTRLRAACAGRLTVQCDGECSAQASVDCTGSCRADCAGRCEADRGSFDCRGNCTGSCYADCDARCAASGDQASCSAACRTNCSTTCEGRCEGTPPSATCEARCEASCEGSCRAEASADCQIDCQSRLEGQCTAELEGGCRARCEQPEGALFCDGQYVDVGNNLERCIDALRAVLNVRVEGSASGECVGNECRAEATGSVSCTASPEPPRMPPVVPGVIVLAAIGAVAVRMNRRGGP